MSISIYLEPISKGNELVEQLLNQEFGKTPENSKLLFDKCVKPHFDKLKDETYLVAETNYVDKVYRDSFYHYYSSKLSSYNKNCIRISFYEGEIKAEDFRDAAKHDELKTKYKGF